jgi:hypothetical protein
MYRLPSCYDFINKHIGSLADFLLSINMSDWPARLATDRGVTCVTRKGDVLFLRQHTFGTPSGTRRLNPYYYIVW